MLMSIVSFLLLSFDGSNSAETGKWKVRVYIRGWRVVEGKGRRERVLPSQRTPKHGWPSRLLDFEGRSSP